MDELIQCPETGRPMRQATDAELQMLRQRQLDGQLCNRLGRSVVIPLDSGYFSESTQSFYVSLHGVLWLIAEEAIPLGSAESP